MKRRTMETLFNADLLNNLEQLVANPIPLDQLLDSVKLDDLWRCDEFIF